MNAFQRAVLATTHNPVVRNLVRNTRPGRALAHRFVAGDGLDDAIRAARSLNREGSVVSLDFLGESVEDRGTALAARGAYDDCIRRIAAESVAGNISVKLTQLGLALDRELAAEAVDHLASVAAEHETSVTIDMEDSRYTDDTLEIYLAGQRRHGNLGVCLQAALRRTPDDLARVAGSGGLIRLCKGAYAEPGEIAFRGPSEVDAAFGRLLERLMADEGVTPAIATHDTVLLDRALRLAVARTGPYEIQVLYGVRRPLQRELLEAEVPLRVYLPYGSHWYPYLTRRMAERPANLMFFLRALVGRR